MKILSIDVGLKNLSYCHLDTTPKILKWETLCVTDGNCKKMKLEEIIEAVLITLNENFDDTFTSDTVLIENQPAMMNGTMKSISIVIYTYFNMMRLQYGNIQEVKFISASNKLKCNKGVDLKTDTYKDRKKASVDLARIYVKELFPERLEWFDDQKKKDDASDSALQAIYYMEKILKVI